MKLKAVLLAIIAPLALAACDDEPRSGDPDWEPNTLADTLGEARVDSAGGLTITLTEWNVRVAEDTIAPGPVTFRVRNIGEYSHALVVEGEGQEWDTLPIAPQQWGSIEASLEPGRYLVYCPVENEEHGSHRQQGMESWLTVMPGAGAGPGTQ